ncbi:MAG TPA: carboxypeptidase regulatory-like domain-containing protein [Candidatus Deferrimicrobium sp.]|nr:carboxypeptidase regulatory-like domain-containing protein [Candidatus Deferrimicrobium sp.]
MGEHNKANIDNIVNCTCNHRNDDKVYGKVTDKYGNSLEGATVRTKVESVITDQRGCYHLTKLTTRSTYVLECSKKRYITKTMKITVTDPPKMQNFTLNNS